ncbi:hypothetical protein PS943_04284 [Pseudomonas fluorescens]|uniref:Uncharacterized protein n=1 Tax=Pseudomonas fluorescens TaxID=294 RepID=A0A5E7WKI5_PSEFL|nr:DUF5677 domain-containing protein [Pseudomonas fluorescens]VVQ35394.1 hypothetical protein PS943_04284 [Pseudomonas fluorescens]
MLKTESKKLVRRPITTTISTDKILCRDDLVDDEIFLKKYLTFSNGKKQALLSRLPLDNILNGFFQRNNGRFDLVEDPVRREMVDHAKEMIRSGHRPALYVYKNINSDSDAKFIAPDDTDVYLAYKELGIHRVPVVILETSADLVESAFQVRHQFFHEENLGGFICSTMPLPEKCEYYSLLGTKEFTDNDSKFEHLQSTIDALTERLKNFHGAYSAGIHYHQTLFSVLYRLSENIQAIRLLIKNSFYYQAVALLRSVYEISLDFYVDWLAPEQVGFWLQTHSAVDRKGFDAALVLASRSDNTKRNKVWAESLRYCYDFLNNVSNKAQMSPLGRSFYDTVYTFTSEVIHQDFNMTEIYAIRMENPEHRSFDAKAITTLVRCVDMIAGKVYLRIHQDIGTADDVV